MSFNSEKKASYGRNIFLMLVLAVITFTVILSGNDMENLITALKSASIFWLLTGLGCMFLFVSCEALNMYQISRSLGWPMALSRCEQYAFIGFYFQFDHPIRQRRPAGPDVLYEKRPYLTGQFVGNDFIYCFCLPDGYAAAARDHVFVPSESGHSDSRPFKISFTLRSAHERRRRRTDGFVSDFGKICSANSSRDPPDRYTDPSGKTSAGELAAYTE